MPTEQSLSQNDVSRFLLGLGIGLVVGFIVKPRQTTTRGDSERVPQRQPAEVDITGDRRRAACGGEDPFRPAPRCEGALRKTIG